MPFSGVLVNVVTVLVGTAVGLLFGGLIHDRFRSIAFTAIGVATLVIGASMSVGGLSRMMRTAMGDYAALVLVGSLVVGSLVGEALRIEYWLERLGVWLQGAARRAPFLAPVPEEETPEEKRHTLVDGFVTASLLFCVGALTVLGSLQDGLGDPSLLYLKATLDGFASIALAATLGAGVGLAVIPVVVIQGGIALGASFLQPFMTPAVIASITCVGGASILALGFDLCGIKRFPVGNMLPSIVIAAVVGGLLGR
ncbi:MAG: DUF554 domain-containing protein [Coriobacteriales bacterium]|nr:DUF554 domain-containing protein [Coriobacteriales bacterium]